MSNTKTFLTLFLLILLGSMGAVAKRRTSLRSPICTRPQRQQPGKEAKARLGDVFLTFSAERWSRHGQYCNPSFFRSSCGRFNG